MIYDVEQQFNKDGRYFPVEARDSIREIFTYRREYVEMQRREDEQKQIADFIGGGQVLTSLSDEIIEDLNKPEIMGIDISQYSTTEETVVPPEIVKFYSPQPSFLGRLANRFRSLFRR